MTTTVQQLTQVLKNFPESSAVVFKNPDDQEFFLVRFIPHGNLLNIIISDKKEDEDPEHTEN